MILSPKRTVKAALIRDAKGRRLGLVTVSELLAMDKDTWVSFRQSITDSHHCKDKEGLSAHCMMCDGEVYIRAVWNQGINLPLFAHYAGSDPTCPWHQGSNIKPDAARANQYRGQQEGDIHRDRCKEIAELVELDKRYISHTINKYLRPTENDYGRYPDVYARWKGFGEFAIEFQMSRTFQTEISARCRHYEREGIPLLWILFDLHPKKVEQCFEDVINRHRNNAFVLDLAANEESRKQGTLVLTCYLRNKAGGFDPPKLVRFDELTFPKSGLPYYEDRLIAPLLEEIEERRCLLRRLLEEWEQDRSKPLKGLIYPQNILVAAAFSIVSMAADEEHNYASGHPNILGMLNTSLYWGKLSPYTNLLTQLIKNTAADTLLETSVGKHLHRHAAPEQKDENSYEWKLLKELFPEALDPIIRNLLIRHDELPEWAQPNSTETLRVILRPLTGPRGEI